VLLDRFAEERRRFDFFMADPAAVDAALQQGAQKASAVADATLLRVRQALGFA
jgi:tryptophanyl-tRNA synthetase